MGLDMYLRGRKYVPMSKDTGLQDRMTAAYGAKMPGELSYIECELGYWRKANHIHKWFVDNCQGGFDECQMTSISDEQLKELKALCERVLATARLVPGKVYCGTKWTANGGEEQIYEDGEVIENADEIARMLPTQDGFFFGGTGYDKWYLEDVRQTIAIVDRALKAREDGWCCTYQSSW